LRQANHVVPLLGLEQLVVGIDGEGLARTIDRPLGWFGGGGDDAADVFQAQAQRAILAGSTWMRTAGFCWPFT
jgi:hypothetical protein